ncbi:MAG: UbiA family prenyltransferase [Nitrososphaerota archaeon]|jgi:geranylgeranylglycerol-phosphate geranylgeranyltransferase|uniref:UbiA family prenyltransferase n=1 Tax=Candidatus Bathycorpusculum sp. TaxID=2994959 RepID=UPI002838C305|nr:UbiA family prenyltransferase [Candidatus Termitimicrobium sp.]MCL2431143.1 UbiA family prenyltransferase [Candidatus Termitimicrobium sp.]MDR0492940.1 UbiA family prenyltransferase [Nitrososphaerota archaeon]
MNSSEAGKEKVPFRSILHIGRPFTSLLVGLGVLAACVAGAGLTVADLWLPVTLATLVGFLFGLASNSINDYLDIEIDKVAHPERPLPSGILKPKLYLVFSVVMFGACFALTYLLSTISGIAAFVMVMFAAVLQIGYELGIKKKKAAGNILMGFQAALGFIFGGVIVNGLEATAVMAVSSFLAIFGREIIKDIEDIKGDVDRSTLPKIIGPKNAGIFAASLVVVAVVISILSYYPFQIFGLGYLVLVIVADCIFIGSIPLIFQNPNKARKLLKIAMLIAIIAFISGRILP